MNILLIYPKFPDTFWSFNYALKFIRKKAAYPPLGLLTVAAMLPDEYERRLLDVNVDGLTDRFLTISCVFPFQHSTGNSGQGAISLLVFNDLDTGAQTQAASPGCHPCYIRPSLPEDMRDTYLLSRVANYPLKPADICLEQIRNKKAIPGEAQNLAAPVSQGTSP